MQLWELLFLAFFVPAFWHGWIWAYRVGVIALVGQAAKGLIGKAQSKIRGDGTDG